MPTNRGLRFLLLRPARCGSAIRDTRLQVVKACRFFLTRISTDLSRQTRQKSQTRARHPAHARTVAGAGLQDPDPAQGLVGLGDERASRVARVRRNVSAAWAAARAREGGAAIAREETARDGHQEHETGVSFRQRRRDDRAAICGQVQPVPDGWEATGSVG